MCDYSLHHVASRPAKVGDKLVSRLFNNAFTRGFAAVGEPHVAVCLLPGTEVAFEKEAEYERSLGIFPNWMRGKVGHKVSADSLRAGNGPSTSPCALKGL